MDCSGFGFTARGDKCQLTRQNWDSNDSATWRTAFASTSCRPSLTDSRDDLQPVPPSCVTTSRTLDETGAQRALAHE